MRVNRTFLIIYDTLIIMAYIIRFFTVGAELYGSSVLFYISLVLVAGLLVYINYQSFLHPTPLEVVAYCVNLIVGHHFYGDSKEIYDEDDLDCLTERFITSPEFEQFFYNEFNFNSKGTSHLKMKLTIFNETFNHTSIIIKTVDDKYIKFKMIKETDDAVLAFLYEWKIDNIEYTDSVAFEKAKHGLN
ncbi:MAG: hypothetical protein ACRCST_15040 [Turicibacter sp.]